MHVWILTQGWTLVKDLLYKVGIYIYMNEERLRQKKYYWTEIYIFGELCSQYLEGKNNHTIEGIEMILLLMQFESLKKYQVPLLLFKIYIYDGRIYHEYLSEILRVAQSKHIIDERYRIWTYLKKYKYDDMLKKYSKYSEEELNEMVENIVASKNLNEKYFIKGCPKKRKVLLFRARYTFNKRWLSYLLDYIAVPYLIIILFYIMVPVLNKLNIAIAYEKSDFLPIFILLFPFLLLDIVVKLYIILKPTKYEKQIYKK